MAEKKIWAYYTDLRKEVMPADIVANTKQLIKQKNNIFFVPVSDDIQRSYKNLPYYITNAELLYNIKDGSEFNSINPIYPEYLIQFLVELFTSNIDLHSSLTDIQLSSNALLSKTMEQWLKACSIHPLSTWPADSNELLSLVMRAVKPVFGGDWKCSLKYDIEHGIGRLYNREKLANAMDTLLTAAWGEHGYWLIGDHMLIMKKEILDFERENYDYPDYIANAISYVTKRGIVYKYAITDESYDNIKEVPEQLFANVGFLNYNYYHGYFSKDWIFEKIVEQENIGIPKRELDVYNGIFEY